MRHEEQLYTYISPIDLHNIYDFYVLLQLKLSLLDYWFKKLSSTK